MLPSVPVSDLIDDIAVVARFGLSAYHPLDLQR
jgi:hypothetical protein